MGQQGDFLQVLREQGYAVDNLPQPSKGNGLSSHTEVTTGTTVFADTFPPSRDNLMKRMRKVDPKQAEKYRQRTGE